MICWPVRAGGRLGSVEAVLDPGTDVTGSRPRADVVRRDAPAGAATAKAAATIAPAATNTRLGERGLAPGAVGFRFPECSAGRWVG